ncbi:HNH endonuclease signature motif containing protein [Streptomyces sp. NPDC006459]|uniref:HNH endonuclease signature motif containing protein n=1 Tax=Streptomyces sp. NPDC006459 TaxID=3154303 RepID=UPI0033A27167
MATTRSYSEQTLKQLFGLSAGRCNFPTCRRKIIFPAVGESGPAVTGDIAHIVAFSDEGPRADLNLDIKKKNSFENLLLLCAACHRLVDAQPEQFPNEALRAMKQQHLEWVDSKLQSEMTSLAFPELEVVCKKIASSDVAYSTGLLSLPPREKIELNALGNTSAKKIMIGLMQAPLVASYVENMATHVDSDFPNRLIGGFRSEYGRHVDAGISGDGLFTLLELFASGGSSDFERQAAGLAVLAHLFQVCDIFRTAA